MEKSEDSFPHSSGFRRPSSPAAPLMSPPRQVETMAESTNICSPTSDLYPPCSLAAPMQNHPMAPFPGFLEELQAMEEDCWGHLDHLDLLLDPLLDPLAQIVSQL